jgi:hypothetical protein
MRPPEAIAITLRFKEALDYVRRIEGRGTVSEFGRKNGININQLSSTLSNPDKRILPPYWIAALCRDYEISPDWILTGRGKMLKREVKSTRHSPDNTP